MGDGVASLENTPMADWTSWKIGTSCKIDVGTR